MSVINNKNKAAVIIADHLKTIIFILKEGVDFGPKGREYILRKLLKRVCLLAFLNKLRLENIKEISKKILEIDSFRYLEFVDKRDMIIEKLVQELQKQFNYFEQINKKLEKTLTNNFPTAEKIFSLYDTLGVPLELIKRFLKEQNRIFPREDFFKLLAKQKIRSQEERRGKKIPVF